MSVELACLWQITEQSLLNCFVSKLHLPFLYPQILSSQGLTLVFHWDHHIRKNVSWSLVKVAFLIFSKSRKISCDHLPECVSLLNSSALPNTNHKLITKAVFEKELGFLWDCWFWLAISCVMNGQACRAGLLVNFIKCDVDWYYHSNDDIVWWIIIHESLSSFSHI